MAKDGLPEMVSEVLGPSKVAVQPLAQAQLACEVVVVDVLPQLLPTEKVDVAELAQAVCLCHMLITSIQVRIDWLF